MNQIEGDDASPLSERETGLCASYIETIQSVLKVKTKLGPRIYHTTRFHQFNMNILLVEVMGSLCAKSQSYRKPGRGGRIRATRHMETLHGNKTTTRNCTQVTGDDSSEGWIEHRNGKTILTSVMETVTSVGQDTTEPRTNTIVTW